MKTNHENLVELRRLADKALATVADAYGEDYERSGKAIERYEELKDEIVATEVAIVIESSRATRRAQELAEAPSVTDLYRDMVGMGDPQQAIKDLLTGEVPDIPELEPRYRFGIDVEDLFDDRGEKIMDLNIIDRSFEKYPIDHRSKPIAQSPSIDDCTGLVPTPPFELPEEIIPPKSGLDELFLGGPSPLYQPGQVIDPFEKFGFDKPFDPPKHPFDKFSE